MPDNKRSKQQSDVQIKRKELEYVQERYVTINDAIDGQHAVKYKTRKYLPLPSDCKSVLDERYIAYMTRAVYYNVCQPTRDALVGQIFLRPPVVELPDGLEFMNKNINGENLTLQQLAKKAANHVLPYGRGGFLADFPQTDGEVDRSEIENGIRPTIRFFAPWTIRNWKVEKIGTEHKIVMLVLDEAFEQTNSKNEFDIETVIHHRVYRLMNRGSKEEPDYCCSMERYDENGDVIESMDICGSDSKPLKEIPFEPIGSLNNDMEIDEPPFTNLANLNLAHFRNSADYEESVFLVGQPTPVYAGLTTDWVENYFDKGVKFGSRASIPLPENGTAELLQAQPNSLAFEAMTHKEDQMIAIGAKIIDTDQKIEKREAEVQVETASQKSILMTVRDNLQMALFKAVQKAAAFIDIEVNEDEHKIELNENFDLTAMDPDELRISSELYQKGEISLVEHRASLLRSGKATETDIEEFKKQVMEDKKLKESLQPPEPTPVGNGSNNNGQGNNRPTQSTQKKGNPNGS